MTFDILPFMEYLWTILWGALWAFLGFVLFIVGLNRYLILMPDHVSKKWLILISFVAAAGIFGVCGFLLVSTVWKWMAVWILFTLLLLDWINAGIRHHYRLRDEKNTQILLQSGVGFLTTRHLVCRHFQVIFPEWKGPSLRIAHLSDLHISAKSDPEFFEKLFSSIRSETPDFVVITGDFLTQLSECSALKDFFKPLSSIPIYASLGNHDFWSNAQTVSEILQNSGVNLLRNETVKLHIGCNSVWVSGVEYPWAGDGRIPMAPEGIFHLVLSHTPDNIYRLSRQGANLVFSGHTHAGQGRLPGWGAMIIPSIYGRRFDHGHFRVLGTHLFITSGLGAVNPPLRIWCKPDYFIVDIGGPDAAS